MKTRGWLHGSLAKPLLTLVGILAACGPTPAGPSEELAPGRFLEAEFSVDVERDIVYSTGAVRSPTVGEMDLLLDLYQPAAEREGASARHTNKGTIRAPY